MSIRLPSRDDPFVQGAERFQPNASESDQRIETKSKKINQLS
jgi:hypothetical protein